MLKEVEEPFEKDQIGSSAMVSSSVVSIGNFWLIIRRPTSATPCARSVCARSDVTCRTSPRTAWTPTQLSGSSDLS
jgi:hypothetical protein